MSNGCVCCSIGGDLTDALMRVLDERERFDGIVIEASGVSDPWRIAQVGLADPDLSLDAVWVLADAAALVEQAADPLLADTLRRQLDAADLIVLNKTDLASTEALAAVRAWLDEGWPGTPRHETVDADLPHALRDAPRLPHADDDTCQAPSRPPVRALVGATGRGAERGEPARCAQGHAGWRAEAQGFRAHRRRRVA